MNLRRYLLFLAVAVAMVVNAQNHPLDIPGADKTKVGIYIENLKTVRYLPTSTVMTFLFGKCDEIGDIGYSTRNICA